MCFSRPQQKLNIYQLNNSDSIPKTAWSAPNLIHQKTGSALNRRRQSMQNAVDAHTMDFIPQPVGHQADFYAASIKNIPT